MNLKEQSILFFTRTMMLGGTENVILQLCEIFAPLASKIVVCSCGGINVEKLNRMSITHYQIPDIEKKNPKVMYDVAMRLHYIIAKEKITVIHTHHRMAAFYVAILGLNKKCTFVNTSHNTFTDKRKLTAFAYKKGHLIACGEMVKKNFVETFGISDRQITVIHNAVRPFDGNVIEDEEIKALHKKGYFVVGNVGRLCKQKGMEYYIQALPQVVATHPKTHFLVIGEGEDEYKLRKLTAELNVMSHITFMGYRSDIQNIMAQLDLVILSSLWEGLPLTPIEAFSVGKTIVATSVDGTVEIVEDGKSGILIEAGKPDKIAEKIIWMMENPTQKVRMENNARMRYDNEFSFDKLAQQYITYYEKID